MEVFKVIEPAGSEFKKVFVLLTSESIFSSLEFIKNYLLNVNFTGDVLIDRFALTGVSERRFVKIPFNGREFKLSQSDSLNPNKNLIKACAECVEDNKIFFHNTSIGDYQISKNREFLSN